MKMIHPDVSVSSISVSGQGFLTGEDGMFDIPPALVKDAGALCGLRSPPAGAVIAGDGARDDIDIGHAFERLDRAALFAYAKANGIGGVLPSTSNDTMRELFRSRLAAGAGPATT